MYGLFQEIGYTSLCYTRSLLFICSKGRHLPAPNSSPSLSLLSSPWQPQISPLCLWVCFCFVDRLICAMFQIPHISDFMWYLSFSDFTSLTMITSRPIHVAAGGIALFFFFNFNFYFILLYNTVLVLPYIDMNLPRVYMSSQSWTLLPPPTPYHLSGSSPCTSTKHLVSDTDRT